MSTKLVRRLLQQTADLDSATPSAAAKHKKSRKRKKTNDQPPVEQEEVIDQQVRSMLFMDRALSSKGSKKDDTVQRIRDQQQRATKIRKKSSGIVLGNSRDGSSQSRLAPEPTFNKKKHKKEKEENKLMEIAKLLRKSSKKSKTKTK
jgi:alkaline phosphatase